jgi:glutathione synthase/RimK-type ligase-like ATP-grasp enzyme
VRELRGWGIFRERTHSPGRESDDTEILRLTGKHLEARGYQIVLKTTDDLAVPDENRPDLVFLMCETLAPLRQLAAWEARGVPHVNPIDSVLNTYRDRMIARFAAASVPFVPSRLVDIRRPALAVDFPVWVKRSDVHNTQDGDVVQVESDAALARALTALAERGIERAVLQPHVAGDLVKFYGVGSAEPGGEPPWFHWFHHADQRLAGHPVDVRRLARIAAQAAAALGLEVYGGDAIVTENALVLLDLNAWPSFARVREAASRVIAAHLVRRVERSRR